MTFHKSFAPNTSANLLSSDIGKTNLHCLTITNYKYLPIISRCTMDLESCQHRHHQYPKLASSASTDTGTYAWRCTMPTFIIHGTQTQKQMFASREPGVKKGRSMGPAKILKNLTLSGASCCLANAIPKTLFSS